MSLRFAGRLVADIMFPPRCALCRREGSFLCSRCTAALPLADGERCPRCWLSLRDDRCFACEAHEPAFESLRSCFRYDENVRKLVLGIKLQRLSSLTEPLGHHLAGLIAEHRLDADALVPVALPPMRQRDRGFNQSRELARHVSKRTGMPVLDALVRKAGQPQAQGMNAVQRRANVRDAFSLRPGAVIEGRTLLLIDDVATTGSTLDACARTLLAGGAAMVRAATVARD